LYQGSAHILWKTNLIDSSTHMVDPCIPFRLPDDEWQVARPEPWMPPQCVVARRSAEILGDKQKLMQFSRFEVFGKQRAQQRVTLDPCVECVHQTAKRLIPAGAIVD
jgi:hypothetical protein